MPRRVMDALADRYRVEREVGAGGMATVFLAEDLKHHRQIALKVLKPELAAILGAERVLKEIEVTANLQHPNILPLPDSGEAAGYLYYVMPFVEGESLRDQLNREKQLPVNEAIRIADAVAAALQFAHERGVVHRDIKPENILLQSGQALVADFGIALAVSRAGGARLTETGLPLGTPHYMSPEQATGDRAIDARSDIYGSRVLLRGDPAQRRYTLLDVDRGDTSALTIPDSLKPEPLITLAPDGAPLDIPWPLAGAPVARGFAVVARLRDTLWLLRASPDLKQWTRLFAAGSGERMTSLLWADDDWIYFARWTQADTVYWLSRVRAAGGKPELRLPVPRSCRLGLERMSRNGRKLVCESPGSHTYDVWIADNFDPGHVAP